MSEIQLRPGFCFVESEKTYIIIFIRGRDAHIKDRYNMHGQGRRMSLDSIRLGILEGVLKIVD